METEGEGVTVNEHDAVQARARSTPIVGWYGDDFTGASDTLATLAQAGLRAMLFLGVPTADQLASAGPLDGIGIAGATRAMSPDHIRAELEPVGAFFAKVGPPILHYKVCSTFDSSRTTGNIVAAIQTLLPHVDNAFVPIVGGQPNLGRYCAFSNLFARAGALGDTFRIDRHPTMSRHPVTPMGEADLRLHLSLQGGLKVAAIHYPRYTQDEAALDHYVDGLLQDAMEPAPSAAGAAVIAPAPSDRRPPATAVLLDVADASHLAHVGRLIWQRAAKQRLLAVGPSSVVQAVLAFLAPRAERHEPNARCPAPGASRTDADGGAAPAPLLDSLGPAQGPVFVFAGSLSPVTLRQIEAASSYRRMALDAQRLMQDDGYRLHMLETVAASLGAGVHTLVYTNTAGEGGIDTREAGRVATLSADFVAQVVSRMGRGRTPLRRVGIAGGDTSSQVTQSLGLWALSYQCTLSAGVTVCRTHSADPSRHDIELMLKGGQVGDTELFNRFAM